MPDVSARVKYNLRCILLSSGMGKICEESDWGSCVGCWTVLDFG